MVSSPKWLLQLSVMNAPNYDSECYVEDNHIAMYVQWKVKAILMFWQTNLTQMTGNTKEKDE